MQVNKILFTICLLLFAHASSRSMPKLERTSDYTLITHYFQYDKYGAGAGLIDFAKWFGSTCKPKIKLYKDTTLTKVIKTYTFCDTREEVGNDYMPMSWKVDYGVLSMLVLENNAKYYKVVVGWGSDKIGYIKKNKKTVFYTWQQRIERPGVNIEEKRTGQIYEKIRNVEGDFLTAINQKTKKRERIRWRKGNTLLVYIYSEGC
jgi:hypothetical protein